MNADLGWSALLENAILQIITSSGDQPKSAFISGIKKQYCQAPA
jgi:hypothetical protein